jgi:hypothetical protein
VGMPPKTGCTCCSTLSIILKPPRYVLKRLGSIDRDSIIVKTKGTRLPESL